MTPAAHGDADELDGLRRAIAARSLGIEADAGLTDALLQRYRRALERRVAGALRRRVPCSADMLGSRCFRMLVRRLIGERRCFHTLREAEQVMSGGWLGHQPELQGLPWLGELVRLESELADRALAGPATSRAAPRRVPVHALHFRSDWDVLRLYDWWRSGARGSVPSPRARVAAIIVGRSGGLRIVRLPCIQPPNSRATHASFATTPPGR